MSVLTENPYSEVILFCHHHDVFKTPFFSTKFEEIKQLFSANFFTKFLSDKERKKKYLLTFPGEPAMECSVFCKLDFGIDRRYTQSLVLQLNREMGLFTHDAGYPSLVAKYEPKIPLGFEIHERDKPWRKRVHAPRNLPLEPKLTSADELNESLPTKPSESIPEVRIGSATATSSQTASAHFFNFVDSNPVKTISNTNLSRKTSTQQSLSKIKTLSAVNPSFTNASKISKQGVKATKMTNTVACKAKLITKPVAQVTTTTTDSQTPSGSRDDQIAETRSCTLSTILQTVVEIQESQKTFDRRQRSIYDTAKEIKEDQKSLGDNLKAQGELISKVISKKVSKKEAIIEQLPFQNRSDFEDFFQREDNRNQLTHIICATIPATEDFSSKVFSKIMSKEVLSQYTWPCQRGNNYKTHHEEFPITFIHWYECVVTEVLQPQAWFNAAEHLKKLRRFLTNARYKFEKSSKPKQDNELVVSFECPQGSSTPKKLRLTSSDLDESSSLKSFHGVEDSDVPLNLTETNNNESYD